MKTLKILLAFAAAMVLCAAAGFSTAAWRSSLKADETVLLFSTTGRLAGDGRSWEVPIHGWVFELEEDSLWRGEAIEELTEVMGIDPRETEGETFRRRARMFLVDSERGKRLDVLVGGEPVAVGPTGPDGHFRAAAVIGRRPGDVGLGAVRVPLEAATAAGDVQGEAFLVGPRGVSVISDIDDTIKVSGVSDKKELLANVFLRESRAVPGMAAAYRRWAAREAAFHYLSASPWQLYPDLAGFLETEGFPGGSIHLRSFRLKDSSGIEFFRQPVDYKTREIEGLMDKYPERTFVLVGDSTESDPEIYGSVARSRPGQVARIFIRDLSSAEEGTSRFETAFAGVPRETWTLFRDGAVLPVLGAPEGLRE